MPERIDKNDIILCRIKQLPCADKPHQILRGSGEPCGPQNSIGARGIKLAKRPISDLAVADHLAIFQTEITQRVKLLPSRGKQHRAADAQEGEEDDADSSWHRVFGTK